MTYERKDTRVSREDLDRAIMIYFPDPNRKVRLD